MANLIRNASSDDLASQAGTASLSGDSTAGSSPPLVSSYASLFTQTVSTQPQRSAPFSPPSARPQPLGFGQQGDVAVHQVEAEIERLDGELQRTKANLSQKNAEYSQVETELENLRTRGADTQPFLAKAEEFFQQVEDHLKSYEIPNKSITATTTSRDEFHKASKDNAQERADKLINAEAMEGVSVEVKVDKLKFIDHKIVGGFFTKSLPRTNESTVTVEFTKGDYKVNASFLVIYSQESGKEQISVESGRMGMAGLSEVDAMATKDHKEKISRLEQELTTSSGSLESLRQQVQVLESGLVEKKNELEAVNTRFGRVGHESQEEAAPPPIITPLNEIVESLKKNLESIESKQNPMIWKVAESAYRIAKIAAAFWNVVSNFAIYAFSGYSLPTPGYTNAPVMAVQTEEEKKVQKNVGELFILFRENTEKLFLDGNNYDAPIYLKLQTILQQIKRIDEKNILLDAKTSKQKVHIEEFSQSVMEHMTKSEFDQAKSALSAWLEKVGSEFSAD